MAIQKITANDIKTQIHHIIESKGGKRKGRIEALDEISNIGKNLINNLNDGNKVIYEIDEEIDDITEQYNAMLNDIENYDSERLDAEDEIEAVTAQIEELESKDPAELTEDEREELSVLYQYLDEQTARSDDANKNIGEAENGIEGLSAKRGSYVAELTDTIDAMDEYTEAGKELKNSATSVGRGGMDVEKALERNESSWWVNADKYGGIFGGVAIGVAVAGGNKTEKYLERTGYEEMDNGMTYYDGIDNEYVAKYDVIEAKGGNQIGEKLRKATAKTYSYGDTIEFASGDIKKKAEDTKGKLES